MSRLALPLMLLLSSCANIPIQDFQACADEGSLGAACDNFLSSHPVHISQPTWDNERFGQFCVNAEALGSIKAEIEKLCSDSNDCTYPVQQEIKAAFSRINRLKSRYP